MMPIKLGTSNINKNEHLILYSFDVNLLINSSSKLRKLQDRKLNDIFPSTYETFPSFSIRIKRGLVNGLGLGARDGERFESLISELQNNQNKISEAINSQNTLSVELIDTFNKTISQVTHNQLVLENKIKKLSSCYTVHRKVVYILHVPIVYSSQFDYYHLYAIPIFHKSHPLRKISYKNELHYAFARDKCTEIVPKLYICNEMDLRRIEKTNPCEVQLLESRSPTTCQEVDAVITEPMMKSLHDSRQWILLITTETTITLSCKKGQEVTRVLGSYLVEIPTGCTLQLNEDWITNQEPVSIGNQPILFPNINVNISHYNPRNFSLHLDQVELDEIHKIRRRIVDNRVDIHSVKVSHIPSFWTIILYGVLLMIVCCFVYKKITPRYFKPKPRNIPKEEIDLSNVYLPR
nr:unnamed protein product [Callosobruchus analis]